MIDAFLGKADKNLQAAKVCFENELYDATANRAYYAAFQAAVAALASQGVKKERLDHKWVQAQFNARFIKKEKKIPGQLKSFLPKMIVIRERADYKSGGVSKALASKQIDRAEEFVLAVRKALSND